MKRTQVLFTPAQQERLAERSKQTGAPIAELIRRAIDSYLGTAAKSRPRKDKAA